MLETLDHTIRIGSTPTFLYFDLYLYSAYTQHTTFILFLSAFLKVQVSELYRGNTLTVFNRKSKIL